MEHIASRAILLEKVTSPTEFASGRSFTRGTVRATALLLAPAGEHCSTCVAWCGKQIGGCPCCEYSITRRRGWSVQLSPGRERKVYNQAV